MVQLIQFQIKMKRTNFSLHPWYQSLSQQIEVNYKKSVTKNIFRKVHNFLLISEEVSWKELCKLVLILGEIKAKF